MELVNELARILLELAESLLQTRPLPSPEAVAAAVTVSASRGKNISSTSLYTFLHLTMSRGRKKVHFPTDKFHTLSPCKV